MIQSTLEVVITCPQCKSAIYPSGDPQTTVATCSVCHHQIPILHKEIFENKVLHNCPCCGKQDFYSQRDFSRKWGVLIYLIPTIICLSMGLITGIISYFLFWLLDLFLYKKLPQIVICYKCDTIFRGLINESQFKHFNHEMNDRIKYSGHEFFGKQLEKH